MENKKHIVAVSAFILHPDGKRFLIVKRNKNEIAYPGKWCFPGGKAEKGHTITETLKREVKEEVGIDVESEPIFVADFTFVRPDGHNVIGITFLVKTDKDSVVLDRKDFDDFKWVSEIELSRYDCIEDMNAAVRKAFSILDTIS